MIVILFFLFLFLVPIKAYAQSDLPPSPSSFLWIDYSYAEPSDTAEEFDAFIDGKLYSDHHILGISSGPHHLKCSKPGYLDYETTFEFPIESVLCYLSKTATLTINVRDNNGNKVPAFVAIDDRPRGEFDEGAMSVARGLHKVTCKAQGYKKYSADITVTNYVPQPVGVDAPTYYSLQCILHKQGFLANLWDKFLTLLSNFVKR